MGLAPAGQAWSAEEVLAKPVERWAIPSWGDVVICYGPGTDASMDSPEALEKTIKRWQARGLNGVTLRSDLADFEPMISRNNSKEQNPRLQLVLDFIDRVAEKFNVLKTAEKISAPLGFKMWVWHPYLYSDGAPSHIGTPGLGRMVPWSYSSNYFLEHPEGITVDRKGNKLWMVREYAYPEARATKISEFVHMAKTLGVKRFIACMRSEVNQLVDPPEKGDQYGFNAPVAEEMKQKYNVDILTDPRFDAFSPDFKIDDPMVENWRKLRGEHITRFYRELRKALDEVDPKIEVAVTLSGEYAGPTLGNQRLDWKTWVDEGLIDAIVAPVYFEGTVDPDAAKKGYLTHVREGVGTIPFTVISDYIAKSPHPRIRLISGGAMAYFDEPPPAGTDGWRVDMWYELYTSAWYQRWSQWLSDIRDFGDIKFISQNFDSFPTDAAKLPPAGSYGLVAHDPKLRACPGGWYAFGDEASGKPVIQNAVRRGETGNAVRLVSNGADGPTLTGFHNSDMDRSNVSMCLDTAITNGQCDFSFWVFRESAQNGIVAYLENRGGELDVGVRVEPVTGIVSYTTGRGPGGTGIWNKTTGVIPVGEWRRLLITVNFATENYSVRAGPGGEELLAEKIPYTPPPPRTTAANGIPHIIVPVPSYKTFRQVLFHPAGPVGGKICLDDVEVLWRPDLVFTSGGSEVVFSDDFENASRGADLHGLVAAKGGKWATLPEAAGPFQIISSTSYREGNHSVLTARRGELNPMPAKPVVPGPRSVITFDLDLLIRSTLPYPYIVPGTATETRNHVQLMVESAKGNSVVSADGALGFLKPSDKLRTALPYDCWMHVQLTVNMATRTCRFAQQQIGQVAQELGTSPLPADFQPGQPLAFRIKLGASNNCVVFDNVKITVGNEPQAIVQKKL